MTSKHFLNVLVFCAVLSLTLKCGAIPMLDVILDCPERTTGSAAALMVR